MIYFEYPLDIHGWKPKPETKLKPELENRGRKTKPKLETQKTETRGYPHRTRSAAISSRRVSSADNSLRLLLYQESLVRFTGMKQGKSDAIEFVKIEYN